MSLVVVKLQITDKSGDRLRRAQSAIALCRTIELCDRFCYGDQKLNHTD
ncbi:hypothetical protein [Anabaena sp. CCY 9614]